MKKETFMKNCNNCRHKEARKLRAYPCMCCELLNPISFNLKWEEEPLLKGDCNKCANRILPIDSPVCVGCGLSRKNFAEEQT